MSGNWVGHQLRRLKKPPRLLLQLAVQRVANRVGVNDLDVPIRLEDIADSSAPSALAPTPARHREAGAPRRVAWVVIPPGAGSGGHTTLFRMLRASADAGFKNTLLFYDRYGSDFTRYEQIVRSAWPWLDCDIAPLPASIEGFDACVASSWPTAHVVANRVAPGTPGLYFIQDYEPYFYPRGDVYAFAEDSYRFGLTNIALGPMVQRTLVGEIGVESEMVPYGGDVETYSLDEDVVRRSGVVFYAKPGNDRRGYRLATLALQRFHQQNPLEPIHAYGDEVSGLPFPVINHGRLAPARLAELYNQAKAGLALSFTNVSLVPEELLACGAIPVVNDHEFARDVLTSPHIAWARATPQSLADALTTIVQDQDPDMPRRAAASVADRSWKPTEDAFVSILRRTVEG